jgi:flagellum-specific peptidoglycan hydrolase FlgJ
VQDWFSTFATLGDCFTRRAMMFPEGRYAPAARAYRETANLEAFVRTIAPIYATDPHYADAVLAIARAPEVTGIIDRYTAIRSFET